MRILVTGAAGFIGHQVCVVLREAGHDVVATDALLASAHGAAPAVPAGVHQLDVRDAAELEHVLDGVDVVSHQAAVVGAGVSQQDAPAYAAHNDLGTATLLAAMVRTGCTRLVLASSMVVYGDGRYRSAVLGSVEPAPRDPADLARGEFDPRCPATGDPLSWEPVDEDAPMRPRSTYAASKVAQEHYALAWAAATGGSVTALRYHNVYGPEMPRDTPYSGVAAIFRSALEAGEAPRVFEDGRQMRDFVHVSDVAAANLAAIERPLAGFVPLNICSGHPIAVGEVAGLLTSARGGPSPVVTGEFRPGDVRHIVASPQRAREVLGFTAGVAPAQGLAEFAFAPLRAAASQGPPSA
ncbi:NAD-dependent epimerase/dehydratase family protein [Aldersonia kunmingensis]|uniref:NAD-dependent epimerase/dehydratase family protein n=1 Tax=Aldersonia kunmingensis TaxID=408066 RepID=UPI000837689F